MTDIVIRYIDEIDTAQMKKLLILEDTDGSLRIDLYAIHMMSSKMAIVKPILTVTSKILYFIFIVVDSLVREHVCTNSWLSLKISNMHISDNDNKVNR